jgi:PEP-CTERM motif
MKNQKLLLLGVGVVSTTLFSARANVVFSDDFGSYTAGNLVGQGPWTITGTSVVNPIQVSSGAISLTTTGQDAYANFSSSVANATGGNIFVGLTLDVTSAQATGDYFVHMVQTGGNTSGFYDKIWAKATTGGYLLGFQDTSGTVVFGSVALTLGTTHRVVLEEDFVSGDKNDTFELYVDPTDTSVAANNTPYASGTWSSALSELASYGAINLRQGTTTVAPAETIDNLDVGTAFSDVSTGIVPEPSTLALLTLGGLSAVGFAFRRKK